MKGSLIAAAATILIFSLLSTTAHGKECSGSMNVTVSVQYTWQESDETEGAQYPSSAHFSPMVCAVSSDSELFVIGSEASEGFQKIAEAGSETLLMEELEGNPNVKQVVTLDGTSPGTSVGNLSTVLEVSGNYTHVACVSMIAPSPDWVVGWTDTDLCNTTTGEFNTTEQERPLRAYDAGTDSGVTYIATDAPTNPKGKIERATEGVIEQYGVVSLRQSTSDDTESSEGGGNSSSSDGESEDESECFPGDANVELEDGRIVTMSKLQVGDRVRVAEHEYSTVFMFTHKLDGITSEFVKIDLESDHSLTVTKGHYLYVDGIMKTAQSVIDGDRLELGNGTTAAVASIEVVSSKGLYNPQTLHGDIVVNGIRASTYTSAIKPSLAHALLGPLRFLHRIGIVDPSAGILEKGFPSFTRSVPSSCSVELQKLFK